MSLSFTTPLGSTAPKVRSLPFFNHFKTMETDQRVKRLERQVWALTCALKAFCNLMIAIISNRNPHSPALANLNQIASSLESLTPPREG